MDSIIVLDTGGLAAYAVAKRIRALRVYAKLTDAASFNPDILGEDVKGVVLAGSGRRLAPDAPPLSLLASAGLPVMAFGRCARLLLALLGGKPVAPLIEKQTADVRFLGSKLFEGLERAERYFDRADELELPECARVIARAGEGDWAAAFADEARALYGTQFSVEQNDPDGMTILRNFALGICGCREEWTMQSFAARKVAELRAAYPEGNIACAVSGGLNSTVAAFLALRAFGERAVFAFADTGLMRKDERKLIARVFEEEIGVPLTVLDIEAETLGALSGVTDITDKQRAVRRAITRALNSLNCRCVIRGELFSLAPDAYQTNNEQIWRARTPGEYAPIERDEANSAHVICAAGEHTPRERTAGEHTPGERTAELLYPLRELFREEARELGELLGLPKELLTRQPFPESGFGARVGGEVTRDKLNTLREADALYRGEIADAALDKKIWQYFATLTRMESGANAIILHALASADALTAYSYRLPYDLLERTTSQILREARNVDCVLYDVSDGYRKLI